MSVEINAETNAQARTGPSMAARLGAEVVGTFILVFFLIGAALYTATFPDVGVGILGVALAVGLATAAAIFSFGSISGGHLNPAITLGLAFARRFPWSEVPGYILAQLVGAVIATTLLFAIAAGNLDGAYLQGLLDGGFASNGYDEHSPGGFGLVSVIIIEVLLTAVLVWVVLGVTDKRAVGGIAALAVGFTLAVIHIVSIPVSNTSVNPARSVATAVYGGPDALLQLWVFILAPAVGGIIAGVTYKFIVPHFKAART